MDSLASNSFKTLDQENRFEAPSANFIGNIALVFFDADRSQLFR